VSTRSVLIAMAVWIAFLAVSAGLLVGGHEGVAVIVALAGFATAPLTLLAANR